MALKFNVNSLDDVAEGLRDQYVPVDAADPSKGFQLSVEGIPAPEDTGALKRALEREREAAKKALDEARRKGEDIVALEASYKAREATFLEQIEAQAKETKRALKEKTALEVASELSGTPEVLLPHVEKRLRVEEVDGNRIVRVLGTDGKMSAMSLADLKAEFRANKSFAAVLTGSRASGSGASGERNSTGGASGTTGKPTPMPRPGTPEHVAWVKEQSSKRLGR